jgi:uncharacterized membrane protein YjdF
MKLKPGQIQILLFNLCFLTAFSVFYLARRNYEFIIYIGVILVFLGLILATNRKVDFPNGLLWGLSVWALLHMSGGAFYIGGDRLYELILIPLSTEYPIFRYDQFVHIIGFGVATYAMFCLLRPLLRPDLTKWTALSVVVAMAGLGVGALNEVVEFLVSVLVPESGVGGYLNTSLDLVADLVGAMLAMAVIRMSHGQDARGTCKNSCRSI